MMEMPTSVVETAICRGTIIHSNGFEEIGHGKFFVVIGVNKDSVVGFFFINSNIHRAIMNRQELLDMQYPMKRSDYPFLKYDSFLSATQIMTIGKSALAADISSQIAKIVGEMKAEHLERLLDAANMSELFSDKEKEDFFSI